MITVFLFPFPFLITVSKAGFQIGLFAELNEGDSGVLSVAGRRRCVKRVGMINADGSLCTVLTPNNNHTKCRLNEVFIWNGLYSEVNFHNFHPKLQSLFGIVFIQRCL